MGYSTRDGFIKTYWPDNTDKFLYLYGEYSISELMDSIHKHFGNDISYDDIIIEPLNIHTDCLTYDLYDPDDYTNFIVITRK